MRVWFLLSRYSHGGLELVQVNLARALRGHGFDIVLVAGHCDGNASPPPDLRFEAVASRGKWWFPLAMLQRLRRVRPALVFTTANDVACLVLLLRPFAFRNTGIVVTQHLSLSGPMRATRGPARLRLSLTRWLMARLLPRADAILAVSHAVAADLARELELDVRSVEVIHNPIVTREFPRLMQEPILWPWADDLEPTVVFVGRLSPEKRLDLLLDALALLGGDQARLLVLGTGPLEGWLRTEVRIRGLGEKCILVGYQANPLPWIRRSDLLVLQSDYEGFGNVLVEAMACGTQVVATDCPNGPSEILDGGTYGQLVPCGDAAALGAAIRRSLNGVFAVPPAILQERASEFSLERAAQSYRRVMSRLVSPTLG